MIALEKVMPIENTLSIIKPDATKRNLTGLINAKFEKAGLKKLDEGQKISYETLTNKGKTSAVNINVLEG